jgi:hypothetical protein
MLEKVLFSLLYWASGFVATFRTGWVVEQALAMERRYPKALTSRIAERSWYPTFLRTLGVLLLVVAVMSTLEIAVLLRGPWLLQHRHCTH